MEAIHVEEYNGKTIKIYHDRDAESPRDWDNQCIMALYHSNYRLGDKLEHKYFEDLIKSLWLEHATLAELKAKIKKHTKNYTMRDYRVLISMGNDWSERFEYLFTHEFNLLGSSLDELSLPAKVVWLPVYIYEHGGITIKTSPFSCMFDSGLLGIAYIVNTDNQPVEQLENVIKGEVSTYNDYLVGNCYGYKITDEQDNDIDSCWGFIGDMDYCLSEAKANC